MTTFKMRQVDPNLPQEMLSLIKYDNYHELFMTMLSIFRTVCCLTFYIQKVAARCNKDATVFIFFTGLQFPLKWTQKVSE